MKVAVVILNWNGRDLLKKFLPSVVQYSDEEFSEIYVADNASTDDSINIVRSEFPSVKIITLEKNYGFAEGYNRALSQINTDYYVLLNSDVEVTENWLTPMLEIIDSEKNIGACMPKIRSCANKDTFEYAGAAGGFIDKFGFTFCRGRLFNINEKDSGQYNFNSEVFWATGACLMIRSNLFHDTGGLDKDFFAHMEEIDLCWRLKNRGHKIYYCHESLVYHMGGGTLNKTNPRKTYLNFRNNLYLLYKNLPKRKAFSIIFIRLLLDGIAGLKFLAGLEFKNFFAVINAHFSFYFTVRKFSSKRKENLKNNTTYTHKEMYDKSIVFQFFLKNKKKFSDLNY